MSTGEAYALGVPARNGGNEGEGGIKGHNVMKGYWDREEATQESIKDHRRAAGEAGAGLRGG